MLYKFNDDADDNEDSDDDDDYDDDEDDDDGDGYDDSQNEMKWMEYKWNEYVTIAVNRNLSICEITRKNVFRGFNGMMIMTLWRDWLELFLSLFSPWKTTT